MVKHNAYQDDPYAKEFGINISDRLASVEARILPAPRVGWTILVKISRYYQLKYNFNTTRLFFSNITLLLIMQLKYNETGREKDCLPSVGQWNMLNKVTT